MTIRACRKAVFSLLLMMLFSLLLTGVNAEFCITLTSSSTKNDTLNCANAKMQLQEVGGKYPIADFSGYSQSDFEEAMRNKNQDGDDIGGNRLFGGNFLAKKSKLSNITIGFYTPRKNIPQSFVLKDNWNLREVTITETEQLLNYNIIMEFTIRNNKRLSEKSINHLKSIPYKLNTSYIQDPGECEFYGVALDSIGDLEDCQKIIGDLIIGSSTQITGMDKIKTLREIHGCLRIKESQIENVDFLNKVTFRDCTKHEITGNKKLCINPEDVSDLNKTLSNALTYKGSDDCEGFCRSEYFLEHKEKACVHIKGKVTINKDYEGDDLSYLSQVKTIKGRLVIRNTNFTNVDFFPKLETVDDSGSQEQDSQIVGTIEIIYNNMLKNVSFPALNTITVGQDTTKKLYVEGNGGNHLPDEVREYFENKFGKGSVLISRLEPPPPPPGRLTHQEEEEAEEERKRKEEKESSTRGIAMLV